MKHDSQTTIKTINRLHNRYTAKLLDELQQVNAPNIITYFVRGMLSRYTNDIKKEIFGVEPEVKKERYEQ